MIIEISNMVNPLFLRGHQIYPPLFLAPMAGITHSAFRRLIAGFGGYGALFTEMLSSKALLNEKFNLSPYIKRRECEGKVIYQLMLNSTENITRILEKLKFINTFGVDINLGCPAPQIRKLKGGIELFKDYSRCAKVLEAVRKNWDGPLTVKCRLGENHGSWLDYFSRMLKLFEQIGVDAITVHPRYFDEKLKRMARVEVYPTISSMTSLPIIANGDINSAEYIQKNREKLQHCCGIMIGRMAVVRPWLFTQLSYQMRPIDYLEIWELIYSYILEDFPVEKRLQPLKKFAAYFSRNFFFSNVLFKICQSAQTAEILYENGKKFLASSPRLAITPSVNGI